MKDIAAICEVSTMSVSLALRNSRGVSEAKRKQINECAKRLGYIPDSAARALGSQRKGPHYRETIAWLEYATSDIHLRSPRFHANFIGAKEMALSSGYQLTPFFLLDDEWKGANLTQILKTRGIRGVMFAHKERHLRFEALLDIASFACLSVFSFYDEPRINRVANHSMQMVQIALREVEALGYKRVGLALVKAANDSTEQLASSGYLEHFRAKGRVSALPPFIPQQADPDVLDSWIRKYRPDCLITYGWDINQIRHKGWKIPEDFGWVSLALHNETESISGIPYNGAMVGASAIQEMIGLLHTNQIGFPALAKVVLVKGEWHLGATTPPRLHTDSMD